MSHQTIENQKTTVKRLAQFLFDNAELIVKELRKSSSYRSVQVELHMFKHKPSELKLDSIIYDEKAGLYYLRDDTTICIERFKRLCRQMNEDAGLIPLPKPVKAREKL